MILKKTHYVVFYLLPPSLPHYLVLLNQHTIINF